MDYLKLAVNLLHVFGYVNATEEDVILKENYLDYIYIEFNQKYISFRKEKYSDCTQWIMMEE